MLLLPFLLSSTIAIRLMEMFVRSMYEMKQAKNKQTPMLKRAGIEAGEDWKSVTNLKLCSL